MLQGSTVDMYHLQSPKSFSSYRLSGSPLPCFFFFLPSFSRASVPNTFLKFASGECSLHATQIATPPSSPSLFTSERRPVLRIGLFFQCPESLILELCASPPNIPDPALSLFPFLLCTPLARREPMFFAPCGSTGLDKDSSSHSPSLLPS